MIDICSEKLIENYLLYKNPLYAFRFPIALILGIFLYGYFEMKQVTDNSYLQQILIPLASILFVLVLLDMAARMMIDQDEKQRLIKLCKLFMSQPHMKGLKLDIAMIENYKGKMEDLEQPKDSTQMDAEVPVMEPMIIPDTSKSDFLQYQDLEHYKNSKHVQPFDPLSDDLETPTELPYKPQHGKCIQNSDCCQLCSGTGENPCNVVTAVPGPQWMPQTAKAKQEEMKNNQFTPNFCPIY